MVPATADANDRASESSNSRVDPDEVSYGLAPLCAVAPGPCVAACSYDLAVSPSGALRPATLGQAAAVSRPGMMHMGDEGCVRRRRYHISVSSASGSSRISLWRPNNVNDPRLRLTRSKLNSNE